MYTSYYDKVLGRTNWSLSKENSTVIWTALFTELWPPACV